METVVAFLMGLLNALFGRKSGPTTPPVVQPPPVNQITRLSDFRTVPTISADTFQKVLNGAHSLMAQQASEIHAAVRGNPVPLAQSYAESEYGNSDNAKITNNPLGLLWYQGSPISKYESVTVKGATIRLLHFDSYADAFKEWQRRMDDPNYKGGVYPQGATVEKFVYTYVGGPDCLEHAVCGNNETPATCKAYETALVDRVNRYYTLSPVDQVPPAQQLTFGKVPLPKFADRRIPDKNNRAYDLLGKRRNLGVVLHRQQGDNWGTDAYFRSVPGGNKANCPAPNSQFTYGGCNGLTSFGIDAETGEALMWDSPLGFPAPGVSANRAPWASGPYRATGGDGKLFVDKYGIDAVNRDLAALEVDGWIGQPVLEAGIQKIAETIAYLADQAKIPWHLFPLNPATQLTFLYFHWEFCGKDYKLCPGSEVENALPAIIAAVQAILKKYQTGAAS